MDRLEHVAKATVRLLKSGGQGVLTEGGHILTVAHNVVWTSDKFGDGTEEIDLTLLEIIATADGKQLYALLMAAEPVNDIAVLRGPDDMARWPAQDVRAYSDFVSSNEAVRLCREHPQPREPFSVFVRTHKHTWISGTAIIDSENDPRLQIETDEDIEKGTSGGPIVNEAGELVGLVSRVPPDAMLEEPIRDEAGALIGFHPAVKTRGILQAPRPLLALPVWVIARFFADNPTPDLSAT